jgi:purine catabolism regulator
VRVRDILPLHRDFDRIWPMCGESGLDNEVRGIDALETSYSPYWSTPNDFIITTGYCMSNGDTTVENWINVLHQRGVAGLGIKIGLFLDELPPSASLIADEKKFPVLFIPPDLKYEDILRPILARLLEEEQLNLPALDSFKTALSNLSGGGYAVDSLMRLLRRYIDHPVELIRNYSFDPVAAHNILDASNAKNFLRKNIETLHPQESYSVLSGGAGKYAVFKINSAIESMAFLAVMLLEGESLPRAGIAIIQEALPLLAICLLSKKAPVLGSSESAEGFFADVIDGFYENLEGDMRQDASRLNIDIYADRLLWIMEFAEKNPDRCDSRLKAASEYLGGTGEPFVLACKWTAPCQSRLLFVSDSKSIHDAGHLREMLLGLRAHVRKIHKNAQCDIGVSGVTSAANLSTAYNEAKLSLEIGRKLDAKAHVYFYESYKIYRLLSEMWGMPALSGLYKDTMGRLVKNDAEKGSNLVNLLMALTDRDFNISAAASQLGLNRKTLKKHMDLIGDIARLDMDKLENRIVMSLMSRMKKILD